MEKSANISDFEKWQNLVVRRMGTNISKTAMWVVCLRATVVRNYGKCWRRVKQRVGGRCWSSASHQKKKRRGLKLASSVNQNRMRSVGPAQCWCKFRAAIESSSRGIVRVTSPESCCSGLRSAIANLRWCLGHQIQLNLTQCRTSGALVPRPQCATS